MTSGSDIKGICTVTELTKKLGLSRARFYQLQKAGVFPVPVYCIRTRRPFYTLELLQKCFDIRKTGIGQNGQLIIFNAKREKNGQVPKNQAYSEYKDLTDVLKKMGLNVPLHKVKKTFIARYPEGIPAHVDKDTVTEEFFKYFYPKCKNDA
jgi:hypothetical protein